MKVWLSNRSMFKIRNDPDSGWNLFFWRIRIAFQVVVRPPAVQAVVQCPPCTGNCSQGRYCPAIVHRMPRSIIPLQPGLTLDEWLQRRMPSDNMGFALALAIVGGIFIGVLLVHAWARMA
jgi:hypothetical protein